MYRIEVASGEETVFRTIEELAVGIRNGVVTPRARIYHHASQKWLPIGLHPHYKKALEMPAASASHAPVIATTPVPTPSRLKAHSSSHPQPLSVVHYPEPQRSPEPSHTAEPDPLPGSAAEPKIPAPVQSPVIAMQNEVLRDLPVISIPEPLPWSRKVSPAVAPPVEAHAPAVDARSPLTPHAPLTHTPITHAPVTYAPITHAPVTYAPVTHAPVTYAPVTHAPVTHSPVTHAPVTHAPVTHAPAVHAPAVHAPAVHAPVVHAPVTHAPVPHAPVPRAPVPRATEPFRSMEYRPPAEERIDTAYELPHPRPTARRSRRMGGRPLLLLGAAASLVVGTHLALTATPSASANSSEAPASVAGDEVPESASEPPAAEAAQPAAGTSSAETRATQTRPTEGPRVATEAPRVTIAPARVPMTPGPAFAGSVPARPGAVPTGAPKATTSAPAPAAASVAPSITPAPATIELALPDLPPDSVVPAARTGDTMGMKKILRALNGAKPAEASAAP
jgi:hypothetical protein